VRQRTLANLGRHFEVPKEQWAPLAQRIEQIVTGQDDFVAVELGAQWEEAAQRSSALVLRTQARLGPDEAQTRSIATVLISTVSSCCARVACRLSTWRWRRCVSWGWTPS
jgi:hypothetical protein